jgi:hypothetical protein
MTAQLVEERSHASRQAFVPELVVEPALERHLSQHPLLDLLLCPGVA